MTVKPPWRTALRWSMMTAAVDLLVLLALVVAAYFPGAQIRSAVSAWVSLHEPALIVVTALLPGLPSAHSPLPPISYVGFGILALGQMAVLGGVLGFVSTVVRGRQSAL
jgi:hypothetical protein